MAHAGRLIWRVVRQSQRQHVGGTRVRFHARAGMLLTRRAR